MQLLQKGFNMIRLIVTLRDKISHLSEYKVLGRNALWFGCGSSTVVYVPFILEWSFLSLDIWMNKMNTRKMSFSRLKTLIYYSRSCFLDISVDLFFFSRGLLVIWASGDVSADIQGADRDASSGSSVCPDEFYWQVKVPEINYCSQWGGSEQEETLALRSSWVCGMKVA